VDALFHLALGNALLATVLALAAAAIGRLCRRPALVHALWVLVLLKLVTPPFLEWRIPWPEALESAASPWDPSPCQSERVPFPADLGALTQPRWPTRETTEGKEAAPEMAPLRPDASGVNIPVDVSPPDASTFVDPSESLAARVASIPWLLLLGGIWLCGSAWCCSRTAYRIYRFHRLLGCAQPASEKLCAQAQRLAKRLGLAACPAMSFVPGRVSPMVWALGMRPRLFLPSALWERLSEGQQATLLVHELAHLRRRDQWIRRLELIVTILYWWHPVVWWACREIREAEEQCCDAWVVWSLPRAAREYATALLATIDFLSETENALPAVASGIGHVHDLRRRLTMIMHGTTPRALSGPGLALVLGLGLVLLPLLPTWAQGQAPDPRPRPEARPGAEQKRFADDVLADEAQVQADRAERRGSELSKARRETDELKREVERMREQLERATKRLEAAQRRLASLQDNEESDRRPPERERFRNVLPRTLQALPPTPRREGTRDSEQRLSALERRLDVLLQEVQSLRREIRRSGPGMAPGMPGGPGAPPGPRPRTEFPGRFPAGPGRPGRVPASPDLPTAPPSPPAPTVAPVAPTAPAANVVPRSLDTVPEPPSAAPAATPPGSPHSS
jgi:beta-lactamase regulating signal transducer with metallopeptidase domain